MGVSDRWEKGKKRARDEDKSEDSSQKKPNKRVRKGRGFNKNEEKLPKRRLSGSNNDDGDMWADSYSDQEEVPRPGYTRDSRPERPPSPDRRPQDFRSKVVYSNRRYERSTEGKIYGLANPDKAAQYSSTSRLSYRSESRGTQSRRGGGGGGGRSSGFADRGQPSNKIFVGRLSFETDAGSLEEAFKEYGELTDCFVPKDSEGRSKGFGFVTFSSVNEAQEAFDDMQGTDIDGRKISLEWARPQRGRGGGFEGGGLGGGDYNDLDRLSSRRDRFGTTGGGSTWGGGSGGARRGGGFRESGFGRDSNVTSKGLDDDLDAYFNSK